MDAACGCLMVWGRSRFCLRLGMLWHSRLLRKLGLTSIILLERDGWLFTAGVYLRFSSLPSLSLALSQSKRVLISSLTTAIFGPAATTWFAFLARRINFPSRPNLTIAARVLTDQTVFASANLGCFLTSMAIMEGSDPKKKLESTYWTALQKNWMLWPAVQAVNFKLVPLEHRVLVVNIVSLGEWIFYGLGMMFRTGG